MEKIIDIQKVTKRFPVGDGEFTALSDIDLHFKKGEFAGLVGPSGSGKTTLLNIMGSLDSPTEGKAIIMGNNISDLSHKQSAELRSAIRTMSVGQSSAKKNIAVTIAKNAAAQAQRL